MDVYDSTKIVECNRISENEYKCTYEPQYVYDYPAFGYLIINGENLFENIQHRNGNRPPNTLDDLYCKNPGCVNEVFCFEGAKYGIDVYRPTATSAMQSSWVKYGKPTYNPVNEQIIRTKLQERLQ